MVTGIRDAIRPNKIISLAAGRVGMPNLAATSTCWSSRRQPCLAGSGHLRCTGFWPDWVCPRTSCGGRRKRSRNGAGHQHSPTGRESALWKAHV